MKIIENVLTNIIIILFGTANSIALILNTIEGRIPAAILDGSLEKAIGLPLSAEDSHVMLCGNPDMVKDTVELLKARNFRKNRRRTPGHITVENYW